MHIESDLNGNALEAVLRHAHHYTASASDFLAGQRLNDALQIFVVAWQSAEAGRSSPEKSAPADPGKLNSRTRARRTERHMMAEKATGHFR